MESVNQTNENEEIIRATPYFKMKKNHLAPFFTCKTIGKRQTKRDHPQARNKSTARRRKMDGDSHPSIHPSTTGARKRTSEGNGEPRKRRSIDRIHRPQKETGTAACAHTRTHTRGGGGWTGLKEALNYVRLQCTTNIQAACETSKAACRIIWGKKYVHHTTCNPRR